jgi:hypothetical protein
MSRMLVRREQIKVSKLLYCQVKKTEMGRTCGTYGGEERCIQGFSGETLGKETTWKTQA